MVSRRDRLRRHDLHRVVLQTRVVPRRNPGRGTLVEVALKGSSAEGAGLVRVKGIGHLRESMRNWNA